MAGTFIGWSFGVLTTNSQYLAQVGLCIWR